MTTTHNGPRPLPVIHINAFPGTGKLAIAKELVAYFQNDSVKIIYNQFLRDCFGRAPPCDTPGYQDIRRKWRQTTFSFLINQPRTYTSAYIFTDFQSSKDLGSATCEEYAACAKARGCDYIPITLHCDEELSLGRLSVSDTEPHGTRPNIELERELRQNAELYEAEDYDTSLTLDVTSLSARGAATKIFEHLLKVSPSLRSTQSADLSDWMIL